MSAALDATRAESPKPTKTRAHRGNGQILPINAPVTLTYQNDSPASWLNFIARAMSDPATNVDKLEVLVRMQREIAADEARLAFNRAMSAVQAEMQPILRDAENTQTNSRYARLETIDAKLRPIYTRHGFCLSFDAPPTDGPNVRIACEVSHAGGHSKIYSLDAALDSAGPQGKVNKTPLHALGSSVSYLRRYLTCMIFHVVLAQDDNDGNRTRPAASPIHPQVEELYALLAQCSADPAAVADNEARFLHRMGLDGVRKFVDVPPAELPRLRTALLAKRDRLAKAREMAA